MEQCMQIRRDRGTRAWKRTRITPTFASAVVPTSGCKLRDLRLDVCPEISWTACRLQNHRRSARAGAEDIQSPATDIDRAANLWQPLVVPSLANKFVRSSRNEPYRGNR